MIGCMESTAILGWVCGVVLSASALVGCSGEELPPTPSVAPAASMVPTATASVGAGEGPAPERVKELIEDAASGDPGRVEAAVALPDGRSITPEQAARLREALNGVDVDTSSIRPLENGVAVVQADAGEHNWLVYLVLDQDQWRISLTEEMP